MNILLGCDTRPTLDGETEHLLILQLAPLGSLRQYLTEHTLDWDTFTKMALGLASALAHLHTHIQKQGIYGVLPNNIYLFVYIILILCFFCRSIQTVHRPSGCKFFKCSCKSRSKLLFSRPGTCYATSRSFKETSCVESANENT